MLSKTCVSFRPESETGASSAALDYHYVTEGSATNDEPAAITTVNASMVFDQSLGLGAVTTIGDESDDDDACCAAASSRPNGTELPYDAQRDDVLHNDAVATKMRNMFETSLKLHETGQYMQACEAITTPLYPHQMYALAWMTNRENLSKVGVSGGILADDMGLGKTLTVLALIMSNFHDKRPLAKPELGYQRSKNRAGSVIRYMPNAQPAPVPRKKKGQKVAPKSALNRRDLFGLGFGGRRKDLKQKVKKSVPKKPINFSDDEEDEFDSMCGGSLSERLGLSPEEKQRLFTKPEKHFHDGLSSDEEYNNMDEKERNERMKLNLDDSEDFTINLDGMPAELESSEDEEKPLKRKASLNGLQDSKKVKIEDGIELPDLEDVEEKGEPEKSPQKCRSVAPELTDVQRKNLIVPNKYPPKLDGRRRATLIVTPASLISHWLCQIEEHVDDRVDIKISVHHGQCRALTGVELEENDIVLTTYGTMMSELNSQVTGPLLRAKWLRVVLDEGHYIKNHLSKTHKAAHVLDTRRRWLISGTPIQNNLTELWALLHWLDFEPYATHRRLFKSQIEIPVKQGHPMGVERLQTVMQAICLRRTKTDEVNGQPLVRLPVKNMEVRELDFTDEERAVYDAYMNQGREIIARYMRRGTLMRNYAHIFAVMMRLRQLCCHRELLPIVWQDVDINEIMTVVENDMKANEESEDGPENADRAKALAEQLREMIRDGISDECSICLSEFRHPVITSCAHVYCKGCITQYIQSATPPPAQCPLCRADVTVKNLLEAATAQDDEDDDGLKASVTPCEFEDIIVNVSSTKVNAVLKELEISKAKGNTDKTIIVSQFTSLLSIIQPLLDDAGHTWTRLDGTMNTRERASVIANFQDPDPDSPRVLLLSLRAGGVGLNLTAANRLMLMDPAWNPSTEEQCFDRIHRLGQTRDVQIIKFIHKNR